MTSDEFDTGEYHGLKSTLMTAVLIGVFQGIGWVSLVLIIVNIASLATTGDLLIP